MLIVKNPTALVFGWDREGDNYEFVSDVFSRSENNMYWVKIIPTESKLDYSNLTELQSKYSPDVIVVFGENETKIHPFFDHKTRFLHSLISDDDLANLVVETYVENHTSPYKPFFSIFTPAYKTGERIFRTYESVKNQQFIDWEWVVVDDSPPEDNELWESLLEIAASDFRVKPHRIFPNSGGKVGLAKNRACSLATGKWLVELDHDDYLIENCLDKLKAAAEQFPDAGFIYSDITEMYDNGKFIEFDHRADWDFYGAPGNYFNFGYSGHSWVTINGKKYLQHHYPSINPLTIRFNITMPNHVRAWKSDVYNKIGGHRETLPLADDLDLIIRTFLETRMVHIKEVLYIQYHNGHSTVDYNSFEINRISRIIKEKYNKLIHKRIEELGYYDWEWNDELETNHHTECIMNNDLSDMKFWEEEQVLNYTYEQ